ncbi:MAG: hypothetical protein MSS15_05375 [Prevotella sp.]|nr:hypothetical protein [Prevotella sp.]
MAEIQTLCLCQWANVLVRCRLYGSVYLVQHGKQQATLTLHQFVCAITALDFLKSFSPYPIRIRTIGKVRPMEADFQGVPFTGFISHRQHPLRMGFPRQLRPLPSPLSAHLCHRVLLPPHRGYPIPSIIDIVNSIRLAKGNVFAEWKQSDTAKLFEDHGYKNKKESSGYFF